MSFEDTSFALSTPVLGAGHVAQRLFAGAPQAEIFVRYAAAKQISTRTAISLRAQKPDILWLLLILGHFEALQPI